jgi:hypothetical protein
MAMNGEPDPVALALVADWAATAVEAVTGAVGAAATVGVAVDDEVYVAVSTLASWSAWLAQHARDGQEPPAGKTPTGLQGPNVITALPVTLRS